MSRSSSSDSGWHAVGIRHVTHPSRDADAGTAACEAPAREISSVVAVALIAVGS